MVRPDPIQIVLRNQATVDIPPTVGLELRDPADILSVAGRIATFSAASSVGHLAQTILDLALVFRLRQLALGDLDDLGDNGALDEALHEIHATTIARNANPDVRPRSSIRAQSG